MVQSTEALTLYGYTLDELNELFYLSADSPSGLRWKVSKSSTAPKGSHVGSYSTKAKFPLWRTKLEKRGIIVARVLWFMAFGELPDLVDHKDGNTKNHDLGNLRSVCSGVNNENRVVQNPNGTPGVYRMVDKNGKASWRCQGVFSGKRWAKRFAVSKYGEASARMLATSYRLDMDEINEVQTRMRTLYEP